VAGYEVTWLGHRILLDPFPSGDPLARIQHTELETPDAILVSHAAFDHLGDTYEIAKRTGAPVICGSDVRALLLEQGLPSEQVRATVWGLVVEINGVLVRPVECHHWSQAQLPSGKTISGVPMGFIVRTEPDVCIYHYGDTAIFSDLRLIGELYKPTIGLLGCSQAQVLLAQVPGPGKVLTGEMDPREAALAAEFLGVKYAVASHYLDLENEQGVEYREVHEFMAAVHELDQTGQREALALYVGETMVVEGTSSYTIERSSTGEARTV
jgi:L-ascorbate metabolism protein UlaG (beta-lactamase superfamily)